MLKMDLRKLINYFSSKSRIERKENFGFDFSQSNFSCYFFVGVIAAAVASTI
ncbi:hypothetical protein [Lactiplantibacillus plantarum]|uniref:hypothetical protein n=1 Tax=Lactiplantibacillus plantarum TaxID=1590 RepID=UPI001939E98F|nr:hypothetical protein [Lactiplantibacillus plantarum]QRG96308.1 hypothetical protein JNO58_15840 [Lactiplantibacillus plantarum]